MPKTPLNKLGEKILKINRGNGWNVPTPKDWAVPSLKDNNFQESEAHFRYKIPTLLALVHSEVSEALEEFRKDHNLDHFMEEIADVLIRTIELGAGLGGNLDAAVEAKLQKNILRGQRHGGRLI